MSTSFFWCAFHHLIHPSKALCGCTYPSANILPITFTRKTQTKTVRQIDCHNEFCMHSASHQPRCPHCPRCERVSKIPHYLFCSPCQPDNRKVLRTRCQGNHHPLHRKLLFKLRILVQGSWFSPPRRATIEPYISIHYYLHISAIRFDFLTTRCCCFTNTLPFTLLPSHNHIVSNTTMHM